MVTACLEQSEVEVVEQKVLDSQCPIWQCGSNSPHIDNYDFHDAHKYGLPNSAGFRITDFRKGTNHYQFDVDNGSIIGHNLTTGVGIIWGAQLVDSIITLYNSNTGRTFLVKIAAVGTVNYWATTRAGTHPARESYVLEWILTLDGIHPDPGSRYKNVCKLAGQVNSDDLMGMNGYHTVLFEGERIDAAAKTIDPTLDVNWFNFGCAGHALAKLELTGHTQVARNHGFSTDIAMRQTMLKMLVADYLGKGIPYTIAGMPLSWMDDQGTMKQSTAITKLEARWTPDGAACLDVPRGVAHWSQELADAFPDTGGDIEAELGFMRPPKCKNPDMKDTDGYHLVTANVW